MSVSTISARIDSNDKLEFDHFCSKVGMNASTAINMFIKAVIREQRIPFSIEAGDSFYSEANINFLKHSLEQLESGRSVTKTLSDLEGMENA